MVRTSLRRPGWQLDVLEKGTGWMKARSREARLVLKGPHAGERFAGWVRVCL